MRFRKPGVRPKKEGYGFGRRSGSGFRRKTGESGASEVSAPGSPGVSGVSAQVSPDENSQTLQREEKRISGARAAGAAGSQTGSDADRGSRFSQMADLVRRSTMGSPAATAKELEQGYRHLGTVNLIESPKKKG